MIKNEYYITTLINNIFRYINIWLIDHNIYIPIFISVWRKNIDHRNDNILILFFLFFFLLLLNFINFTRIILIYFLSWFFIYFIDWKLIIMRRLRLSSCGFFICTLGILNHPGDTTPTFLWFTLIYLINTELL